MLWGRGLVKGCPTKIFPLRMEASAAWRQPAKSSFIALLRAAGAMQIVSALRSLYHLNAAKVEGADFSLFFVFDSSS